MTCTRSLTVIAIALGVITSSPPVAGGSPLAGRSEGAPSVLVHLPHAPRDYPVSRSVAGVPAPGPDYGASIAGDDHSALVVWGGDRGVTGARVAPNGRVKDRIGFHIAFGSQPDVSLNGSAYLVAWIDFPEAGGSRALVMRLDRQGKPLDPEPILLSHGETAMRVATSRFGRGFIVTWLERSTDADSWRLRAMRLGVRTDGTFGPLDGSGLEIAAAVGVMGGDVAGGERDGLIVWAARSGHSPSWIGAVEVGIQSGRLVALESSVRRWQDTRHRSSPRVARGEPGYLVTWTRAVVFPEHDIAGVSIPASATGDLAASEETRISDVTGSTWDPAVTWTGDSFVIVWTEGRGPQHKRDHDILASRVEVTRGGALARDGRDTRVVDHPQDQGNAAVAAAGTRPFVVWTDRRQPLTHDEIYGTPVDVTTDAIEPLLDNGTLISMGGNPQLTPSVAHASAHDVAVWEDLRKADWREQDVYASRLTGTSTLPDGSGVAVADGPGRQGAPDVAAREDVSLVVWIQETRRPGEDWEYNTGEVWARRIDWGDGEPVLGDPVRLSQEGDFARSPSVVVTADGFLAAWVSELGVSIRRFGVTAEPSGPAAVVLAEPGISYSRLDVGAVDGGVIIGISWDHVRAFMVATSGDTPSAGPVVDVPSRSPFHLAVGSGGPDAMIVWNERYGPDREAIRAVTVRGAASSHAAPRVIREFEIFAETRSVYGVAVTWTGRSYQIVVDHGQYTDEDHRLDALRLGPRPQGFGALDEAPVTIARLGWEGGSPALAASGQGGSTLAFVRQVTETNSVQSRYRRLPDPPYRDRRRPVVRLDSRPRRVASSEVSRIVVSADEPRARFLCSRDFRARRPCGRPRAAGERTRAALRFRRLRPGWHNLRVWAVDASGNRSARPATARWRVVRA